MYFNVNFNVFFKLIKVHLLVSEVYMQCILLCYRSEMVHCSSINLQVQFLLLIASLIYAINILFRKNSYSFSELEKERKKHKEFLGNILNFRKEI